METSNTPVKQGLLASLASHETGQAELNANNSNQGLRPRLPNRFEGLDAKMDTASIEEQPSETSIASSKPGFINNPLETVGLQAVKSSGLHEHLFQPKDKSDLLASSLEPVQAIAQRNAGIPEAESQFRGIWTADHRNIISTEAIGFKPPVPDSSPRSRPIELSKDRLITEKLTTVERETLREIHSLQPSIPKSERHTGLLPKMQAVQAQMPLVKEQASQPNIEIHIGRIEVRANIQATQPKPEKMPVQATNEGALQAYLQNRSRGARS